MLFAIAILLFSFQQVVFKKFNSGYMKNAASCFMFNGIYFILVCVIYVILGIDTSFFELYVAGLGSLFAVTMVSAVYFYLKALENGPLGLSFLFFSAGMLGPVIFGVVFYNDPAPLHRITGLIMLFVAFFISTRGKDDSKMNKKWVIYILLSSLSNAVLGISVKLSRVVVPEGGIREFMFLGFSQATIISFVIGLILMWKFKEQIYHFRTFPFALIVVGAAITTAGGNYAVVILSQNVSALIQFPVINGALVITSIFTSRVVFKEQITKQHLLTMAIGLVAIILLSL